MPKLILPKEYLSWSQLNLWLSNKERYRKEYFENTEKLDTKYLRFGKGFAKLMEDIVKDPSLLKSKMWVMENLGMDLTSPEHVDFVNNLKWYDTPEFEIRCEVLGVPILSFIDSYNSIDNLFYEFKTGKNPWDQSKVQKHDQLVFYAMALKHSKGKTPESCELHWIQTKEGTRESVDFWRESSSNKIHITGKIQHFHREFDEREVDRLEDLLLKSAEEISEAYQEFIKEI